MRKLIINIATFATHGGVMAYHGHMFNSSWLYWITLLAMLIVQINCSID